MYETNYVTIEDRCSPQSDVTGTRSRPHLVFRSPLVVTGPPRSVPTALCAVTSLTGIPSVRVHHWSAGHYGSPLQNRQLAMACSSRTGSL